MTEIGSPLSVPDAAKDTSGLVGQQTGTESALSTWAGPYVTDMLGRGQALGQKGEVSYNSSSIYFFRRIICCLCVV